jgi:hypothetical protein
MIAGFLPYLSRRESRDFRRKAADAECAILLAMCYSRITDIDGTLFSYYEKS